MATVVPRLQPPPKQLCRKVYLGLYDSRSWPEPDSRDEQRVRDFMVQKYENKRWYVAPTESMKEEARRMNEVSANKQPAQKPLRQLLGDNTPKLVLQNNQSPQMNRTPPANPGPITAPPQTAQVAQPPQPTAPAQPKPPAQSGGSGFDLLGDLGGDPFASTPPATTGGGGGFADFSSFGSQPQPAAQAPPPSAFPPLSSAPLQPLGGPGQATPAQTPPTAQPPTALGGGGDKYAALADLDSVFGAPAPSNGTTPATTTQGWSSNTAPATVNWGGGGAPSGGSGALNWGGSAPGGDGTNLNWNGTSGTSSSGWNSQPSAPASNSTAGSLFSNPSSTTAANPFGGSVATTQAPAPVPQANPFGAGGPQPPPYQQAVGFTQYGQQFGMQNGGGFGTTAGGFGFTQSAPSGANPGFGAPAQPGFPAAQQQAFPAAQPQGFTGGWGQPAPQAVGNPFMVSSFPSSTGSQSSASNTFSMQASAGQSMSPANFSMAGGQSMPTSSMQAQVGQQMPTPNFSMAGGQSMPSPNMQGQAPNNFSMAASMPTQGAPTMPSPGTFTMPGAPPMPAGGFSMSSGSSFGPPPNPGFQ